MLTLEQCRKKAPALKGLSDEEVLTMLSDMCDVVQMAFDQRPNKKVVPKIPLGLLSNPQKKDTLNP